MGDGVNDTLCVPMKLDAFILNTHVCDGGDHSAKIAPITQPNYTSLRLKDALIQNDILPHFDLHNSYGHEYNSRLTNLESGKLFDNRQGVYLHWMLPRVYRAAVAATEESSLERDQNVPEHKDSGTRDKATPQYRPVPTRWLVIRHLRESTPDYKTLEMPPFSAWVIESDYERKVDSIKKPDVDLQVDVSPFIAPPSSGANVTGTAVDVNIQAQAEIFIGRKTPVERWTEVHSKPKVEPLTVLNGGNILFPDFQPHNGNVFSILDSFDYTVGGSNSHLEKATADYYVVGWHIHQENDPLHAPSISKLTRSDRLKQLQLALESISKDAAMWGEEKTPAHTICHGAMYDVKWTMNAKPKHIPADKLCEQLHKTMPVAVGMTPLDSLLAYIKAHQQDEMDQNTKTVMEAIINIQKYLLMQEDTVDEQEQAEDLLYTYNYDAASGGIRYHVAGAPDPTKPTETPDKAVIELLSDLNQEQSRFDSLKRLNQRYQWKLFARWWDLVSSGEPTDKDNDRCKGDVKQITEQLAKLKKDIELSDHAVKSVKSNQKIAPLFENRVVGESVHPNFYLQRDPTVLVGHLQSSWPIDWLEPLSVRLNTDITTWENRHDLGDRHNVHQSVGIAKLPQAIQETALALITEFVHLRGDRNDSISIPAKTLRPLYHDKAEIGHATRRDEWEDTQPFFPLFLEWEVEYAHIDFDLWSFEERDITSQDAAKLSYGMKSNVHASKGFQGKEKKKQNLRVLSGRVLILPQPSFSLKSQIDQVFSQTPPQDLDAALKGVSQTEIKNHLSKLSFLSSPLAGFHDHLLTTAQGTHIKPTIRFSGGLPKPISDAAQPKAGFDSTVIGKMGAESDPPPYGNLVHVSTETNDSAFKPVTHGQFKFTKLNIIDKFGQVIHALDPRWDAKPQYLLPCLSDYYAPQVLENGKPNTVESLHESQKGNHYAQIPPHINQWARVNSEFVERNEKGDWVPQNEWDNPIWGWMVYNYLDYAIQFFLPNGTFYREVSIGGALGARKSEKWLPFTKEEKGTEIIHGQLDRLIDRLGDQVYLEEFIDMIQGSMHYGAPTPEAYAQFLNSIVGRPLALVNMAWSLELATDQYENHSTINEHPTHRSLLEEKTSKPKPFYEFKFKIGDQKRSYDGLVGYFKTLKPGAQKHEDYLDLEKCYTFFGLKKTPPSDSPLLEISPSNYPTLKPHFIDPRTHTADEMAKARNRHLAENIVGAIIDPFNAVHAYTGILPIQPLELPTWTWQDAMSSMTAFFHLGPLPTTKDVPAFNKDLILKPTTDIKRPGAINNNGIKLPTMGSADWAWLQPYDIPDEDGDQVDGGGSGRKTVFMPLGLKGTDAKPRFEEGPYTAVEGYLQLRRPIVRGHDKAAGK